MEDRGTMNVFAHSNGGDVAKWQTLQDHCKAVAELSKSSASREEIDYRFLARKVKA